MKKRTIAIVAGGDSSEWEVSLRSAQGIYSFIPDSYQKYIVTIVGQKWEVTLSDKTKTTIDKNDFSFIEKGSKITFDFAYITIHGTPGENGILQGYFNLMRIPFSGCDVLASSLSFDKYMCNLFCKGQGVPVAESVLLRKGDALDKEHLLNRVGLPCFVKPNDGGSSFGVTKVKSEDQFLQAITDAFAEGASVMVESLLEGTEVTCGMYMKENTPVVFPITEVVTDNDFFDYNAKYNGEVDEITPARIPLEWANKITQLTQNIYQLIQAKGIIRVDYIIDANGQPYLLEVNTTPGMTATSFIPQQIEAAGLNIQNVMVDIIEA